MAEQDIDILVEQRFKERMAEIGRRGGSNNSDRKKAAAKRNIKKAQMAIRQLARTKRKKGA